MMARNIVAFFHRWRQPQVFLSLYAIFFAIGTLTACLLVFRGQSESGNTFILGYSTTRIWLGAGLLVLSFVFMAATLRLIKHPEWSQHLWNDVLKRGTGNNAILWTLASAFVFCWIVLFLPPYRVPDGFFEYIVQLQPLLVWILIVSAVVIVSLLFVRGQESTVSVVFINKTVARIGIIVFCIFIFMGALTVFTGVGVVHREDYWYGAGVPVLGVQVFFSLAAGMAFVWIQSRLGIKNSRKLDVFICVVIWIVTAWLWAREPLSPNYFLPDTARNNIYPYSDSATFDIGSQFALIGQGLFNGKYFDRVLYSAFLTYLHVFAGQKTEFLMIAQSIVYAVFPVIIYLLGKELHGRVLGVSASVLILLRGINAIVVAPWVDLSSPKMMLTDFPTAIGIALIMLFILRWLKKPTDWFSAVLAGGMIGMTLMLRTHVLLMLPFLALYMWVSVLPRWKYGVIGSLLLILGMLTATLPWDIRNLPNGRPLFYLYYSRIEQVLRARYGVKKDTYYDPPASLASAFSDSQPPYAQTIPRNFSRQRMVVNPVEMDPCRHQRLCMIVNNFFHNLVTSVVFLPASFVFDDLWNVVKESVPYWEQDWAGGGISLVGGSFLIINLALIALGIGTAWSRNKITGFLPAVLFLTYVLSNALALTSGGRYITPVDWIVCLYYMLGVLYVAFWGLHVIGSAFLVETPQAESVVPPRAPQYFKTVATLMVVFVLGFSVPAAEMPFEKRYQKHTPQELLETLESQGRLKKTTFTREELSKFLSDPRAKIIEGRMLYPRYYRAGKGETKRAYPYIKLDYSRLAFITISPYGYGLEKVIARGGRPRGILHAADVIIIGCKNRLFFDALVVFVISEPGSVYIRFPLSNLQCPMQPQ
jgi:hypothetical protein